MGEELEEAGRVLRLQCRSALWRRPGRKEGRLDKEESEPLCSSKKVSVSG